MGRAPPRRRGWRLNRPGWGTRPRPRPGRAWPSDQGFLHRYVGA